MPSPLALLCLRIAAHSGPLTRRIVRPWSGADSQEKKETGKFLVILRSICRVLWHLWGSTCYVLSRRR